MKFVLCLVALFAVGLQSANSVDVNHVITSGTEGDVIIFVCLVHEPIRSCSMKRPSSDSWYNLTETSFFYVGSGFERGECGICIYSAQPEDDGLWTCQMQTAGESEVVSEIVEISITKEEEEENGSQSEEPILRNLFFQTFDSSEEEEEDDEVENSYSDDSNVEKDSHQPLSSLEGVSVEEEEILEEKVNEEMQRIQKEILNTLTGFNLDTNIKEMPNGDLQEQQVEELAPSIQEKLSDGVIFSNEDKRNGQETDVKLSTDTTLAIIALDTEPYFGHSASFVCQTNKPLQYCLILPPRSTQWISFNDSSIWTRMGRMVRGDKYVYEGYGLSAGDCGVVIPNPQPQDNGVWTCKTQVIGESVSLTGQVTIKARDSLIQEMQELFEKTVKFDDSSEETDTSEEESSFFNGKKNVQRTHNGKTLSEEQVKEEKVFLEVVFIALTALAFILLVLMIAVAVKEISARRLANKFPIYTGPRLNNGYARLHPEIITSLNNKTDI